jgi:hypothetical protein
MPAKSEKQEKFMQAVAHNPAFAKKVGVPVKVGKEFTKSGGGEMKESKAMVKKEVSFMKKKGAPKSMIKHEMKEAGMKPKAKYMSFTEKGKPAGMKPVQMASGGLAAGHKAADGIAKKGKTKGKEVKMAMGGAALGAIRKAAMGAKKIGPINPNAVRPGSTPRPRPVPPPPGLSRPQNPSAPMQSQMQAAARQQATAKPQQPDARSQSQMQFEARQRRLQATAKSQQPDAGTARAFADYQKQREAQQKLDAARPTGNAPMGQDPQTVANLTQFKNNMREISPADFKKVVGKKAGGLAAGHKEADGIAKKGKTRAMQVKMAGGGKAKKYC